MRYIENQKDRARKRDKTNRERGAVGRRRVGGRGGGMHRGS